MNKKMTNYIIRLLCALIAAVAIFTIIIVGNNSEMQSVIDNNITKLKKLENVSVARTQLIIKKTSHTTAKRKVDLAKVDFNKVFESCVLVGDSITEGAYEYKFLDKDVAVFNAPGDAGILDRDLEAVSAAMASLGEPHLRQNRPERAHPPALVEVPEDGVTVLAGYDHLL